MNSVQESKQELEAAIRYAENAISSAKQTIESMVFRQEMAKKQSSEKTGREEALENQLDDFRASAFEDAKTIEQLNKEVQRQQDLGQGYYDSMMTFKAELEEAKTNMALMTDELVTREEERTMLEKNVKYLRDENERLKRDAEFYKESYTELEVSQGKGVPTMPVIPKDVAIAIFRHGALFGVEAACDEIEGSTINISETGYTGDFEVSFERDIDLDDHIDFDWVRGKVGDYDEDNVTANLEGLCAKNNFECRIHGIDKQEEKKND